MGRVKVARAKIHNYLGMIMDFTQEGAFKIDIKYFIEGTLEELPYDTKATKKTPWTEKLLEVQEDAKKLEKEQHGIFLYF